MKLDKIHGLSKEEMDEMMKMEYKKQDLFLNIVAMATFIGLNDSSYKVTMNSVTDSVGFRMCIRISNGDCVIMCDSSNIESMTMMGSYLMNIKMEMVCGEYESEEDVYKKNLYKGSDCYNVN